MSDVGLDDYYDLIVLLGRVSVLVEMYYDNLDDDQLASIDSYYETMFFHIKNRTPRPVVLSELTSMTKYIDDELKKMNM